MATGTAEGSAKGIGPNIQEDPEPMGTRRGCAENQKFNSGANHLNQTGNSRRPRLPGKAGDSCAATRNRFQ